MTVRVSRIPETEIVGGDEEWRVLIRKGSGVVGGLELDFTTEMLDALVEQYLALRG
jgi:hypothetical protein